MLGQAERVDHLSVKEGDDQVAVEVAVSRVEQETVWFSRLECDFKPVRVLGLKPQKDQTRFQVDYSFLQN